MGVKRKQHRAEFKARVAMAALSGEKTLAELSAEFGSPDDDQQLEQELVKRAGELFARGSKAPAVENAQKVIDELHRKIGQLQVECDFLAGQPAISRVLRGGRCHFAYYAVPTNSRALSAFRHYVTDLWRRTLRRRSQKSVFTWERMTKLVADWLPPPRILHPWPDERFDVRHPR